MKKDVLNYQEIRKTMKDGDVLMFKGKGLVSWLIKKKTNSEYSHVGIVAWWNDRLMVLEAVGKGLKATPISLNLEKYHGGIDYYKPIVKIENKDRKKMLVYAQEQLGKEYAKKRLFKYFIKVMFSLRLTKSEKDDTSGVSGTYFCSHYVAAIYNSIEIDLAINISDKYTTPDQIANSDVFECVGVLKKYEES